MLFINAYLPGRMFGYGAWEQIKDWRYIILSVLIMVGVVCLILSLITNFWLQLFIGGLVGLLVYIGSCVLFNVINDDILVLMKIKKRNDAEC